MLRIFDMPDRRTLLLIDLLRPSEHTRTQRTAASLMSHPNPIGAAQAKIQLAWMEDIWREYAGGWACGRQDHFGEQMDDLRAYIRESGVVLH